MKKLLLTTVLSLFLALPVVTQASNSTFGMANPVAKKEVGSVLSGGYVAVDLSDTYNLQNKEYKDSASYITGSDKKLFVFDINIMNLELDYEF